MRALILIAGSFTAWFLILSTVQNSMNVYTSRSCKPPVYTLQRVDMGLLGVFTVCKSSVGAYGPSKQLAED
jgi:hypothetical protein